MWRSVVEQVRQAGPRKVVIFVVLAAAAVVFAYGNNSTNDAASGKTLARAPLAATLRAHATTAPRP